MQSENRFAFVQRRLPWLIAGAGLVLYLATVNRWVSLTSLPVVSAIGTPESPAPLVGPIGFLVTYPFRWLPLGWQPLALNLLSAVFAAATLGLLARSVALLPHDRTRDERQKEQHESSLLSIPAAWAPPLFAALVCGLQLTFWENATTATGEMLNLLLFAYTVRCLLEFRVGEDDRWLFRLALVYGLAITNNYAMLGFLPAFLIALIWIKGGAFFDFRFVSRMTALGLIGLLPFLLLPLLNLSSDSAGGGFWPSLRYQFAYQKSALQWFPRYIVLIAALTSLLPVFLIGIRWPSTFGDTSVVGAFLTQFMFHVVHAMFWVACALVAFDAPFSPRSMVAELMKGSDEPGGGVPFLSFYYLGALAMGYFAGYYLLVLGPSPARARQRESGASILLSRLGIILTWVAIVGVPAGLFFRNLAPMRWSNGTALREFATLTSEGLPDRGGIALSDQPHILTLVGAYRKLTRPGSDLLLADTRLLPYPTYYRSLHQSHSNLWPALPETPVPVERINRAFLMQTVADLAASNQVFYLHPSFGYYFERVYAIPNGLSFRIRPLGTNQVGTPPLSQPVLDANQAFWKRIEPQLLALLPAITGGAVDAVALGRWYSRAANLWGVELQRQGRFPEAAGVFDLALLLNPLNASAEINREYNAAFQSGNRRGSGPAQKVEDRFGNRYRSWDAVLAINGPLDEPSLLFQLGQTLAQQNLLRQAENHFLRSLQLDPDNVAARLWLANIRLLLRTPDRALEATREILARAGGAALDATTQIELARLDAIALFESGRTEEAEALLKKARQQHPQSRVVNDTLLQIYLESNRLTNALAFVDEQLRQAPGEPGLLLTRALIGLRLPDYDVANSAVAQALAADPKNVRALLVKSTILVQKKAYPEALDVLNEVLRLDPENIEGLLTKSAVLIETGAYQEALAPLDLVLDLQPENQAALLNRAIANLQSGRLDDARRDYETLRKLVPTLYSVYYGLGEIAYQRKEFRAALKHYDAYLKFAPAETKEARAIQGRIQEMKSAGQ